jgi:putative ABC transport system permease protein
MLRNLARNRRRNLLTTLSIAVSLFIFSALASLPSVIDQLTLTNSSQRLVCVNKASIFYPLPESYRRRILALPHVKAALSETYFGGMYHDSHDQLAATSLDIDQIIDVYPDFGIDPATLAALKHERMACLAGVGVMRLHHWRVGDHITLKGTLYPIDVQLKIVGTLGRKYPTMILMRRDYLEEILPDKGWANDFWIRIDSPHSAAAVIAAIDETFANSSFETRTGSEASFIQSFLAMAGPVFELAAALAVIVLVTIGLVAANTAAMSIRERLREVAVMRAIGFTNRAVTTMLIAESAAIGLVGGLAGCVAAYVVLSSGTFGEAALAGMGVIRMPPRILAEGTALGALIGLAGALIPALAATRRNIVDQLRAVA